MPEENKKDNLIDVGDADEAVTEVNLDEQQPKEAAKEEEKIEVEQVEAKPVEEKREEKKENCTIQLLTSLVYLLFLPSNFFVLFFCLLFSILLSPQALPVKLTHFFHVLHHSTHSKNDKRDNKSSSYSIHRSFS